MFIYGSSSPGAISGGVIGGLVSLAFICAIVCVCVSESAKNKTMVKS